MAALSKGAGVQEGRPLNLCLETDSFFPSPLPLAGPAWKQPLEMGPREPGRGAGLAPASNSQRLSQAPFPSPLRSSPKWGQEVRGRAFSLSLNQVRIYNPQPPPHTQHGTPPTGSSLGRAGDAGKSALSFPKRLWELVKGANPPPWGYCRAGPWVGPLFFPWPGMSVL